MARSSSAKNGKNSKNTYRASGSKSSKSSSSGARHNSSASGSKKRMSRLEQRRAQQQNLIRSVVLAGFGILAIALVLVPGQSFWNVLRSWLFGTFGVVTYFVGPFLLYLAYLLASGYHVGTFIGKVLLLAVLLAGTAVIFSDFKVGDTPWQTVKMLFAWGQRKFWTGGDLSLTVRAKALRDVTEVAPLIQAGGADLVHRHAVASGCRGGELECGWQPPHRGGGLHHSRPAF